MNENDRMLVGTLHRSIHKAIWESEAVWEAMAAMAEAGLEASVSIDVTVLEAGSNENPAGAYVLEGDDAAFDNVFLHDMGIVRLKEFPKIDSVPVKS